MASYAALLSLMQTINHIQNHPRPPISIHEKQLHYLMEHIKFLQRFLESYLTNGGEEDHDSLESRVTSAAHAAEDVIESHIVDQIHGGSNMSAVYFGQRLEKVIQDLDLIKEDVMEIMTGKIIGCSSSTWRSSTMVDPDVVLVTEVADRLPGEQSDLQIIPIDGMDAVLDKLTGQPSNLLIIPVIGMGGIDPPHCAEANFVLNYMQTLSRVRNFKCSKEAIKRMPNIRTLKLLYYITDEVGEEEELPNFYLSNLGELGQLQCLNLMCNEYDVISHPETFSNFTFPDSLKKLTLHGTLFLWEDMTSVIGTLPCLEFLKLSAHSCTGPEWETAEGGFCNLKFLLIEMCSCIKYWKTEDTHFPCLEHLVLRDLQHLEEIPSSIGDVMTLQSVLLERCSESASDSAQRIKEEQEELGNVDLKVHIVKVEGKTDIDEP